MPLASQFLAPVTHTLAAAAERPRDPGTDALFVFAFVITLIAAFGGVLLVLCWLSLRLFHDPREPLDATANNPEVPFSPFDYAETSAASRPRRTVQNMNLDDYLG